MQNVKKGFKLKENILYLFIVFSMLGCGAQNNPIEEFSSASEASSDSSVSTLATTESNILLPKSVAMDFPNALKDSSNSSFNKKVNRIQKAIDSEKYNFELLKLAIAEIEEACPESNATCNFGKDNFRVNHNHQTVLLGEINFIKSKEENKSSYALLLTLNDDIQVRYEWKEDEKDVFTTYLEGNNSLLLHYFKDNNQSEASYINDSLPNEKNSFMINVENNGSSIYHLTSNHIKNDEEEFSTNLRVEDTVLIENNESFFTLSVDNNESNNTDNNESNNTDNNVSNDVVRLSPEAIDPFNNRAILLDYIVSQDLKDGDYLVFDANNTVEDLNLGEQLKSSLGRFTYFKEEVFGLVFNDVNSSEVNSTEIVTEFKIIPLDKKE